MHYRFSAKGHINIRATHNKTFELTKDKELGVEGDCIIGVDSDFKLTEIKDFITKKISNNDKSIIVKIEADNIIEDIHATINPDFNDAHEIVIRKTGFLSGRTLGIGADKSCKEINESLKNSLKNPDSKINIILI